MPVEQPHRTCVARVAGAGAQISWPNTSAPTSKSLKDMVDEATPNGNGTPEPSSPGPEVLEDPGKVSPDHPVTSHDAADFVKLNGQRAILLALVVEAGLHGLNNAEAAPKLSERLGRAISRNQTATRMGELREKELVQRQRVDGVVVLRTTGGRFRGEVHEATDAGRALARELLEGVTLS